MRSVQRFAQRKITFHACANVTRRVKRSENRQVVFTNENTPNRKPPLTPDADLITGWHVKERVDVWSR